MCAGILNLMIGHITGTILATTPKYALVNVQGIGYQVHLTEEKLRTLHTGGVVSYWTYLAVRETSLDLFGFDDEEELQFFEMLLDVSGIGPRSALSIIGVASINTIRQAIAQGDTSYLTKVSGIGKRTAERIVVELRDRLGSYMTAAGSSGLQSDSETIEALQALGYSLQEARTAAKEIPSDLTSINDRIKAALQIINK
jgi:Holliday junction DNA helicase RuvA